MSNSSSSSFLCNVCGRMESGYDASPGDFMMYEGICGHTFCQSEINTTFTLKELLESVEELGYNCSLSDVVDEIKEKISECGESSLCDDEFRERMLDIITSEIGSSEMIRCACPICSLKYIPVEDRYYYLLRKFNLNDTEIENEINSKFNNLDELQKYERGKE